MGWLGLLGALSAPAALGAIDGGGMVFLAIAYAATIAVLVWQRWTALAGSAFVHRDAAVARLVLIGARARSTRRAGRRSACLNAALALGLEARRRRACESLDDRRGLLLALNAAILAASAGALGDGDWLVALAARPHRARPRRSPASPRISRELALIVLAIGVVLADIALRVARLRPAARARLGRLRRSPFAALLGARRRPVAMDQLAAELRTTHARPPAPPRPDPRRRHGRPAPGSPPPDRTAPARAAEPAPPRGTSRRATGCARVCDASAVPDVDWTSPVGSSHSWSSPSGTRSRPRRRWRARRAAPTQALVAVATIGAVAFLRRAGSSGVFLLDALALTAVAQFTGLALEGAAADARARRRGARARSRSRPAAGRARLRRARRRRTRSSMLAPPVALLDGLDQPLDAAAALARRRPPRSLAHHARPRARRAVALLYLASVEVVTLGRAGAHRPDAAQRAVGARGRRRARSAAWSATTATLRHGALGLLARHGRRRCSSTTWRRWTRSASGR